MTATVPTRVEHLLRNLAAAAIKLHPNPWPLSKVQSFISFSKHYNREIFFPVFCFYTIFNIVFSFFANFGIFSGINVRLKKVFKM